VEEAEVAGAQVAATVVVADGLLDRIEAAGGGDLIAQVTYPLPSTVARSGRSCTR
jgi:hypothetical protein